MYIYFIIFFTLFYFYRNYFTKRAHCDKNNKLKPRFKKSSFFFCSPLSAITDTPLIQRGTLNRSCQAGAYGQTVLWRFVCWWSIDSANKCAKSANETNKKHLWSPQFGGRFMILEDEMSQAGGSYEMATTSLSQEPVAFERSVEATRLV